MSATFVFGPVVLRRATVRAWGLSQRGVDGVRGPPWFTVVVEMTDLEGQQRDDGGGDGPDGAGGRPPGPALALTQPAGEGPGQGGIEDLGRRRGLAGRIEPGGDRVPQLDRGIAPGVGQQGGHLVVLGQLGRAAGTLAHVGGHGGGLVGVDGVEGVGAQELGDLVVVDRFGPCRLHPMLDHEGAAAAGARFGSGSLSVPSGSPEQRRHLSIGVTAEIGHLDSGPLVRR